MADAPDAPDAPEDADDEIVDLAATNRGNVTQTNHREQGHNRRVHQLAIATRVHLVVSFQYQHREIHT